VHNPLVIMNDPHSTNAITHAFEQIEVALNNKLRKQGYEIAQQVQDDKSVGSRYIMWSNNGDAVRLAWDGRDGCFILAVAPLSSATAWDHLITAHYDPHKHDEHYVVTIATEMVDSLN
jgi:hypothetical protein